MSTDRPQITAEEARAVLGGPLPRARGWRVVVWWLVVVLVAGVVEAWWTGRSLPSVLRDDVAQVRGPLLLLVLCAAGGGLWWRRERRRLAGARDVERVVVREAIDLGRSGGTSLLVEAPDGLRARWAVRGHEAPAVGEELACTPLTQDHLARAAWRGPRGPVVLEPESPVNIEWNPRWRARLP